MISAKNRIRSEEIRQQSQHVLFVEGQDKNSLDPKVLGELLDPSIKIETLGPSYSVKSVAEGLFKYHPTYYFLIDRDHHDDDFVESCWKNFPNPERNNLLVWRRRELENYFLDPKYLSQSKFCRTDEAKLEDKILKCANTRLFLDAANYVVTSIREELKQNWIQKFTNPAEFSNKEQALDKLQKTKEFNQYCTNVHQKVSFAEIEHRFIEYLQQMIGGEEDQLKFGHGNWLNMIQGKPILLQVINSNYFQVTAKDGTYVMGRDKLHEIVKDLLRNANIEQPDDFVSLKRLIQSRINETSKIEVK